MMTVHNMTPRQVRRLLNALDNDDVREVLLPVIFAHVEQKKSELIAGNYTDRRLEDVARGHVEMGTEIIALQNRALDFMESVPQEEFRDDDAEDGEELLHVGEKSD